MKTRLGAGLGLCLLTTFANAAPPEKSLWPKPRPGATSEVVVGDPLALVHPKARPSGWAKPVAVVTANAPVAAIRPMPRPAAEVRTPVVLVSATPAVLPILATVAPPDRPENLMRLTTVSAVLQRPPEPEAPVMEGALCGDPKIKGELIAPIVSTNNACGLEDGVKITSVAGIRLSPAAEVDCQTARAFRGWVEDTVVPSVGRLGGGLEKLQIAGSYSCRPRNNQRGNKISEHGKGHAIDVAALFLENGAVISVLKDWGRGRQGKILKAIRRAACGPFTTVLGPGSDRFHRDHLHLDTARGRGPYCK